MSRDSGRMIERLSADVINRIAAGEVVQRPCAALKELLENAVDSGATTVQVLCNEGGVGLLQVTDDGSGVRYEDLPLLCERFATSKLRSYEDLGHMTTFGFRGEALASISHVAKLTAITMRRGEAHGWRCRYADGALIEGPVPCASNPGTTIRVEDMFFNAPVRRSSLARASEELSKILDVLARYSLMFPQIAWSCMNQSHSATLPSSSSTSVASSSSKQQRYAFVSMKDSTRWNNLKSQYGSSFSSHLHHFETTIQLSPSNDGGGDHNAPAQPLECQLDGYGSDATLNNRKSVFVLFINQRLVESSAIRRCLEQRYAAVLTGGNKFAVFLFLTLPPERTDVNVHPTKHEVFLLDEVRVVAALSDCIVQMLAKSAASRQQNVGVIDHQAVALKPVSHSSTNVAIVGHRGVMVAPCTISRVEEQRGDILKYAVKVDRFALLEEDKIRRSGSGHATNHVETVDDEMDNQVEGTSAGSAVPVVVEPLPTSSCTTTMNCDVASNEGKPSSETAPASCHCCDSSVPPTPHTLSEIAPEEPEEKSSTDIPVTSTNSLLSSTFPNILPGMASLKRVREELDDWAHSDEEDDDDPQRMFRSAMQKHAPPKSGTENHRVGAEDGSVDVTSADTLLLHSNPSHAPLNIGEPFSLQDQTSIKQTSATVTASPSQNSQDSARLDDYKIPSPDPPTSGSLQSVLAPSRLTSVQNSLDLFDSQTSPDAVEIFQKLSLVGIVDAEKFLAQSGTTLFMVRTFALLRAVVPQRVVASIGARPRTMKYSTETAPSLAALLDVAWSFLRQRSATESPLGQVTLGPSRRDQTVASELMRHFSVAAKRVALAAVGTGEQKSPQTTSLFQDGGETQTCVPEVCLKVLLRWRRMLRHYFGIDFIWRQESGHWALSRLPLPLGESWPANSRAVPLFLLHLGLSVDYSEEERCLSQVTKLIGEELYGRCLPVTEMDSGAEDVSDQQRALLFEAVRFGLIPAVTNTNKFRPSLELLTDGTLRPVVSVEALYRVFERC